MGIENTELASLPDYQINISFFQKYPHTKIEEKNKNGRTLFLIWPWT